MVYQWLHPAGSSERHEVEKCTSHLLMLTLCSCRLLNDTNTPDHRASFTGSRTNIQPNTQFICNVIHIICSNHNFTNLSKLQTSKIKCFRITLVVSWFLVRDAFVRINRRATAMMFVCLSVRLSGMGIHCDHTVYFSTDLSLWLDS